MTEPHQGAGVRSGEPRERGLNGRDGDWSWHGVGHWSYPVEFLQGETRKQVSKMVADAWNVCNAHGPKPPKLMSVFVENRMASMLELE